MTNGGSVSDNDKQKALLAELAALNAEWYAITAKRKAWMDEHMPDFAKYPIGTELYYRDRPRGAFSDLFGVVVGYYRYAAKHNPQSDTHMSINYEVETRPNCRDNTSRLPGGVYSVESREERAERMRREAERLARPDNLSWLVPEAE